MFRVSVTGPKAPTKATSQASDSAMELKGDSSQTTRPLDEVIQMMTVSDKQLTNIVSQINSLENKEDQAKAAAKLHAMLMQNLTAGFRLSLR